MYWLRDHSLKAATANQATRERQSLPGWVGTTDALQTAGRGSPQALPRTGSTRRTAVQQAAPPSG